MRYLFFIQTFRVDGEEPGWDAQALLAGSEGFGIVVQTPRHIFKY